jgi:membrane fusion protein (multidrug efflux system)
MWRGARRIGLGRVIFVGVVVLCALLVGFNMLRTKMIGQFFATMQAPPVTVSATKIEPRMWTPEIQAIGTLWAIQGVDVATQVAGVVKSIAFKANERVAANQLLVQIDDEIERADVLSAEAAVARDRAQLERTRQLRTSGVNSAATLEEAQSTLAASESNLAKIRAVLDQKAIEAPFAGIVGIPQVDVGEYVQPGTVIATLQQLDTMRVDFTVPEQQAGDLTIGQPASFGLTETDLKYRGKVIGIDPKVDPQMRLVSVRAELENPDNDLRPGQFVRIRVELPSLPDVIVVPQTAIVTSLYGDYVYVVESEPAAQQQTPAGENEPALRDTMPDEGAEPAPAAAPAPAPAPAADGSAAPAPAAQPPAGKLVAKQIFVKMGRRQRDLVEITEGLQPGQTIVTSGQNKLTNNATVVVNNAIDPATVALDGNDTP